MAWGVCGATKQSAGERASVVFSGAVQQGPMRGREERGCVYVSEGAARRRGGRRAGGRAASHARPCPPMSLHFVLSSPLLWRENSRGRRVMGEGRGGEGNKSRKRGRTERGQSKGGEGRVGHPQREAHAVDVRTTARRLAQ